MNEVPISFQEHVEPECVRLPSDGSVADSRKPPVRIFVGTESGQFRAERIFVWSIEAVRNPARVYEVYIMKELRGFDRRRWLTGFTNYRFAIPSFAGGSGVAIYNDVDQIYLSDPAELFDRDMRGHGFLSIAQNDSSVMLMDCAQMVLVWNLELAQHERKNALLKKALANSNLWGKLEPEWNARDEEFRSGESKVLHYTALHTQPWQPFPTKFVYQESPEGKIWKELEAQANRVGYHFFSRSRPSSHFAKLVSLCSAQSDSSQYVSSLSEGKDIPEDLEQYMSLLMTQSLLLYSMDDSTEDPTRLFSNSLSLTTTSFNILSQETNPFPSQRFDLVYSGVGLSRMPDDDIPWILEEMFQLAGSCVYIHIQTHKPHQITHPLLLKQPRDFHWWTHHLEAISLRHPSIHWKLLFQDSAANDVHQSLVRCGGKWIGSPPQIWILSDGKVGHDTQSERLAKSLGWPYEIKQLHFHSWNKLQKLFWGMLPPATIGLNKTQSSSLRSPWPDIVISTGWRPAPIARWIREQNEGKTRIIQLGRKGGASADLFDVVITPGYYGFAPHPRRIETLAPLNEIKKDELEEVTQRWPKLFGEAPYPRIVLVVGGSTARFILTKDFARSIANQLKDLAHTCGGKVFAVTSPRTGKIVSQALQSVLMPDHHVHQWEPHQTDNPYLAYLDGADVLIVTGESESMLAEAASLGKPIYIIPLPENPPNWKIRLNEAIVRRAESRPLNKRGTVRPQQGIERFCARLIRAGLVQPRRNLSLLHDSLIKRGIAQPFGEPIENGLRPQLREIEHVAKKTKSILGIFDHENV